MNTSQTLPSYLRKSRSWLALAACCAVTQLSAAPLDLVNEGFESYTDVAASLADAATDADPTNAWYQITDDTPLGSADGSGLQVQTWQVHSGTKALLLRPNTTLNINIPDTRSGSRYTLDFWLYANRGATASHNWYIMLRGMGADNNGEDIVAYQSNQATNSTMIRYYDGIDNANSGYWSNLVNHAVDAWQHHRIVVNAQAQKADIYLDDMTTALVTNVDLARMDMVIPTQLRINHSGNSDDDGYFLIDDVKLTVDDPFALKGTFTENFESYTARANETSDADPAGPWITVEMDGTGSGRLQAPGKVQVVDATVEGGGLTAHSGTKCLKLQYGQRAGSTIAWGYAEDVDVQITYWARVPSSVDGATATYLRFSLYGAEGQSTSSGDAALLGYGSRDATIGDETSLVYYTTAWKDTLADYTPDTWEEYQITTHNVRGSYSIVKNPSSASPVVVVDNAAYVGSSLTYGPMFMAAWSSSNGTNHPPVYVDDITIKSVPPDVMPQPYTPTIHTTRFTNYTELKITGPVGAVAVDPRDNSTIAFTIDATPEGAIYKATKVAKGNWAVDSKPIVSGLSNPSGLKIDANGTLWWVHDYTAGLMRLKSPWDANTPELVISDLGNFAGTPPAAVDDDPFDLCIAPAGFTGGTVKPGDVVVMDRGVDDNAFNALFYVDPATTTLNQTEYKTYLVEPNNTAFGNLDLVAMTALPDKVATLCLDGQITQVDAQGGVTQMWPDFYPVGLAIEPAALAADPNTGRFWVADDIFNEVWSCDASGLNSQRELSFPLINPLYTGRNIDFHEPGMAFSPDGKFVVVADTSIANGGGRLIIFHSEPFEIATFKVGIERTASQVKIAWESAGGTYNVLRGDSITNPAGFINVSGDITTTSFTDTNAPGPVFYRVVAKR